VQQVLADQAVQLRVAAAVHKGRSSCCVIASGVRQHSRTSSTARPLGNLHAGSLLLRLAVLQLTLTQRGEYFANVQAACQAKGSAPCPFTAEACRAIEAAAAAI